MSDLEFITDLEKKKIELFKNIPMSTPASVQPVQMDYFTDGTSELPARSDHQHPLSKQILDLLNGVGTSTIYVKKSGDTITGLLTFNPVAPMEVLRIVGTNSFMSWYNTGASVRTGYLQGNAASGLILNSEAGPLSLYGAGGITMSNFTINGFTGSASVINNRIVLSNASGYIFGNYFNMIADTVTSQAGMTHVAGQASSDNYLRWFATPRLNRWEAGSGQNQWNTCGMSVMPTVGVAAISFHTGGAPMIGSNAGFGNNLYHRDANWAAGSSTLVGAAFTVESSKIWKKNINEWPMKNVGAAVESALDLVMKLKPITYQLAAKDYELPSERRTRAWQRLNAIKEKRGEEKYELPVHDCAQHDCHGSADSPCTRHRNHNQDRLGFTAEEVYEIIPNACQVGLEMEPVTVDYGQLTVVALQAIKELSERVIALESVV